MNHELLLPNLLFFSFVSWNYLVAQNTRTPLSITMVKNLSDWLEVATWQLTPAAKRRIQAEIETHYAESRSSALAKGAFDGDANAAALAGLGDPQLAGRCFRREHLLESEMTQAIWYQKYAWTLPCLAFGSIFPILITGAPSILWGIVMGLLQLTLIAVSCAVFFLSEQKSAPSFFRRLIDLYAVFILTLGSMFILFSGFVDDPSAEGSAKYLCMLAAMGALIVFQTLNLFRLHQKLAVLTEADFPLS